MKLASIVLIVPLVIGLNGEWAFANASVDELECFLRCCPINFSDEARREAGEEPFSVSRLDLDSPIHWELLDVGRKWERGDLRPPLYQEIFPDPRRDPRLGSYSRSPITLRYWWE